MTGLILNRYAGYLTVDFSHRNSRGWVDIRFKVHGDTLATTECDESFNIVGQEVKVRPDAVLDCWTTLGASHFFLSMVRWLEAVLCEVQECAFVWEGEGPDGELRWFNGREGGGHLELKWSGGRSTEPFDHQVALARRQMIQALYEGFRGFVESDRYDPMSYESLTRGEAWKLVVADGPDALIRQIAACERFWAYALICTVGHFAHDTDRGPKRQATVAEFLVLTKAVLAECPTVHEGGYEWRGPYLYSETPSPQTESDHFSFREPLRSEGIGLAYEWPKGDGLSIAERIATKVLSERGVPT